MWKISIPSSSLRPYFLLQTRATPYCVFWDESLSSWSDFGCNVDLDSTGSYTTCACNHTTNFAVLFDIEGDLYDLSQEALAVLDFLSTGLCAVSALCCLLTFVVLLLSKYGVR